MSVRLTLFILMSRDYERRYASSRVVLDGKFLGAYVVEVYKDKVVNYYPLTEELPFVEYIEEGINLKTNVDGCLIIR